MLKSVTGLIPLVAPYFISFRNELKDIPLMKKVRYKYLNLNGRGDKLAVFSDTSAQLVSLNKLVKQMIQYESERQLTPVFFGLDETASANEPIFNYRAIVTIGTEKEQQVYWKLPPFLKVAYDLVNLNIRKIYHHTFGPMAIYGFLLGKLLNIAVISRFPLDTISMLLNESDDRNRNKVLRFVLDFIYSNVEQVRCESTEAIDYADSLAFSNWNLKLITHETEPVLHPNSETIIMDC